MVRINYRIMRFKSISNNLDKAKQTDLYMHPQNIPITLCLDAEKVRENSDLLINQSNQTVKH